MNCWKMNDQLLGGFIQTDGGKPVQGTFLQKFYQGEFFWVGCLFLAFFVVPPLPLLLLVSPFRFGLNSDCMRLGRDEQAVRPAATGM